MSGISDALFAAFLKGRHSADANPVDTKEARAQFIDWLGQEFVNRVQATDDDVEQALDDLFRAMHALCDSCIDYHDSKDGYVCSVCGNELGNFRFEMGKHDERCQVMTLVDAYVNYMEKSKRKPPIGDRSK